MAKAFMLSTIDNPFSPFTEFDSWYNFDIEKGYNSCSLLACFSFDSDELSEDLQKKEINRAIDEIISLDPVGIFMKVEEPSNKMIPPKNKI